MAELGLDFEASKKALKKCKGDLDKALDMLRMNQFLGKKISSESHNDVITSSKYLP
jgi:translation elongation factor EF-Ts